jgi:hypothetical protein
MLGIPTNMPKIDIAKIIGQISLLGFMVLPVFSFTYSKVLANDTSHPGQESEVTTVLPTTPPASDKSGQENSTTGGVVVGSRENVINLIKIYFSRDEVDGALAVAKCESGFNAKAKNPNSSASGVFQIIRGTFKQFKCEGDVFSAEDNIKCARKIYDYYGGRWSTSGGWEASAHCHLQP